MKQCTGCNKFKANDEFQKTKSKCKNCLRIYLLEHRRKSELRTWKQLSDEEKNLAYKLSDEGKTPAEIGSALNVKTQSIKTAVSEQVRDRKKHYKIYLQEKIKRFCCGQDMFTVDDLLEKIGENKFCYITGDPIDITDVVTWELDHIIPRSKGGPNTLENCAIATTKANWAKGNLMIEEFIELCGKVADKHSILKAL